MRASTLLLPLLTVTAARADRVLEPPKRAWPTALAIVVDEATWHSARAEIEAYRAAAYLFVPRTGSAAPPGDGGQP